jgi:gluconate 5-dehydrogenase
MNLSALFSLHGRRALITGSGQGLGFRYAEALADAGAEVVLNDLNEQRLDAAVARLRARGATADGIVFNVARPDEIHAGLSAHRERHGPFDILINNAGIHRYSPLADMTAAQWQEVIDVNLSGAFHVSKAVVAGMISRRRGKIINICSLMSEATRPTTGNYTAAKGGLKLLTKSMAVEWAPHGIQANGIGPGYILSEMTAHLAARPDFDAWVKSRTPAGRWGAPDDLAGAAVFLSSPASDFINGQVIYVDGGWLAAL